MRELYNLPRQGFLAIQVFDCLLLFDVRTKEMEKGVLIDV